MKKKLIMILPVLLIAAVGYKMFLAPKPVAVKMKIEGTVMPLQKDFLVNLADGQYAKVAIAVITEAGGAAHGAETLGLAQEAAVRAIIVDELTGIHGKELVSKEGRHHLAEQITKMIKKKTDEHVHEVLFTDVTVQ